MKTTVTLVVLIVCGALTAVLSARTERDAQNMLTGEYMAPVQTLVSQNDIDLKNGKAKYKYKADTVSDAQQKIKLAGKFPTGMQDFNGVQSFRVRCRYAGQPDAVDDMFGTPTGVQGKKANRYKQKFFYYTAATDASRSEHHSLPTFGKFKAWIKNGEMYFVYALNKMNQGGMMVETADYQGLKDVMSESNKVSSTANLEGAVDVATWTVVNGERVLGLETHDIALQAIYKANQKAGKAKYLKQ
jgi:hypothetical protein